VASSILLWLIRLQYRVHLSERHLSLDASEKKAFAETFLAMKEGADVSAANETIILQSLFRPTQDGIIKDDESGFDFSAAALLAKQLGRDAK
jgi:RNA-splicing ligase RtcB